MLVEQNQINFKKNIKPYLSKKNTSGPSKVILTEYSKFITKQNEVIEIFNSFFTNVASDIGKGVSFASKITIVYVKSRRI